MSAEPRLVGLTDEEVNAITLTIETERPTLNVAPLLKAVARIVAAREVAAEQAGREDNALHDMCYVSGSKALEAREAAARREALLEAADAWAAQKVPWSAEVHGEMPLRDGPISRWLRDRAALAEPERDEPCSDVTRVDHAADHYAMTGRDNYRCERDEESGR